MAICLRDAIKVDRLAFDGQRQRDALTALQKTAGLDATEAATAVGLSYPQYNRYLWGRVPLRTDQLGTFAAAYGVTKADLSRALGLLDDDIDAGLRARAAEAVGPDLAPQMPDALDEIARTLSRHTSDAQDDVLAQMRSVLGARRDDAPA